MMDLKSLFTYSILLGLMEVYHCDFLAGTLASCDKEGEEMTVSLVDKDPCIRCFCRNNKVTCDVKTCPPLDCALEDIIQIPGVCCQKCKKGKPCQAINGMNYEHGKKWRKQCATCECVNGKVECKQDPCNNALECPKNYKLTKIEGECCPRCVQQEATCTVFGDPHYVTFDGKMYDFQGTCKYTMVKTCETSDLHIRVRNMARMNENYSWTKMVAIYLKKAKIFLQQKLEVRVDRKRIKLPFIADTYNITSSNHYVHFEAKDGVRVVWDGDSYLEVTLPREFRNKVCGLCGNYNGIATDDLTGSDNKIYYDGHDFGDSWRIGNKKVCMKEKTNKISSPCRGSFSKKLLAHHECSVLYTPPFQKCRDKIDIKPYFKACITDVCDCPKGIQCSCEALTAYARACERHNVVVNWKTPTLCGTPKCFMGAVYKDCKSACPRTCANPQADQNCSQPCVSGCECAPGLVLHDNKCIKEKKCTRFLKNAKDKKAEDKKAKNMKAKNMKAKDKKAKKKKATD